MDKEIIAGFGEVMLRLAPEGKKRLAQVLPGTLQATFGGGEANVCASLAMLGAKSRYLTVLPDNPIAQAFATEQRGFGTDVSKILWTKTGRMGVYYAEHGAAQRGSNVIYDRAHLSSSRQVPAVVEVDTPSCGIPIGTVSASDDVGIVIAVKVIHGLSRILEIV